MRRHYANYFKGIPHFKEYRMKLVTQDEPIIIREIFQEIEAYYTANPLTV
jgi:hypothetical protein